MSGERGRYSAIISSYTGGSGGALRGEEFVVVLPAASVDEAARVAGRIQASLREAALPHAASAVSETVTVSMGIALSGRRDSVAGVIACADEALYQAKQQGRNRWMK